MTFAKAIALVRAERAKRAARQGASKPGFSGRRAGFRPTGPIVNNGRVRADAYRARRV